MKIKSIIIFLLFTACSFYSSRLISQNSDSKIDLIQLSQAFLKAMQEEKAGEEFISSYTKLSDETLINQLDNDEKKYAFWINTYNAFIQYHLQKKPEYYEDRGNFFKLPLIDIGGTTMSFAEIEHGILRRSQLELFLGYLSNPFASKREKSLRVENRDYRIHFSLNCGAKSCPPVAIYGSDNLNDQLDYMSKKFHDKFSRYNKTENLVTTTALFSWFRGDFDGPDGIRKILKKYEVITDTDVRVVTEKYDWTLSLDNFLKLPY